MSTAENRPVGPAGVLMPGKDDLQKEPAGVLLSVKDLCMYFDSGGRRIKASEHVSFDIREGETFGLVGEAGSGRGLRLWTAETCGSRNKKQLGLFDHGLLRRSQRRKGGCR